MTERIVDYKSQQHPSKFQTIFALIRHLQRAAFWSIIINPSISNFSHHQIRSPSTVDHSPINQPIINPSIIPSSAPNPSTHQLPGVCLGYPWWLPPMPLWRWSRRSGAWHSPVPPGGCSSGSGGSKPCLGGRAAGDVQRQFSGSSELFSREMMRNASQKGVVNSTFYLILPCFTSLIYAPCSWGVGSNAVAMSTSYSAFLASLPISVCANNNWWGQ